MPFRNELPRMALALLLLALSLTACDGLSSLVAKVPGAAQLAPSISSPSTMVNYTNTTDGYSLKYPSTWTPSKDGKGFSKVNLLTPPNATVLTINVLPFDPRSLALIYQLKGATASTWLDAFGNDEDPMIASKKTDVSTASAVLGGQAARQIIYTDPTDSPPTKWLNVYTINGSHVYLLMYMGRQAAFDANLAECQTILNSFTFSATTPAGTASAS